MTTTTETRAPGRGRIIATRVVAGIGLAMVAFGVVQFVGFLGASAEEGHQVHDVAGLMLLIAVMGAALVRVIQRPADSDAAVQMLVGVPVLSVLTPVLAGEFDPFTLIVLAVGAIVAIVSPSSAIPSAPKDYVLLGGAVVGLALVPYAIDQIQFEANAGSGDPHGEFGHYAGMAAFALSPSLLAFIASTKREPWRLPAWVAGLIPVALGVSSLVFGVVSSLPTTSAVIVAAAGVIWIGLVEAIARRDDAETGVPVG